MFIVIEKGTGGFWQDATIVTDEDGKNKEFGTLEEAQAEADECQDGIVVGDETADIERELTADLITMLRELFDSELVTLSSEATLEDKLNFKHIIKTLNEWQK